MGLAGTGQSVARPQRKERGDTCPVTSQYNTYTFDELVKLANARRDAVEAPGTLVGYANDMLTQPGTV